jgi:hypothetical protein
MPETFEIPVTKRTSTTVGMMATAETLASAGIPVTYIAVKSTTACRDTSNRRGNYNSWDPRKANGSNNIGHSRVSSNSRGRRIIIGH